MSGVRLLCERKRQTGEKRDGERARHVAAPSGRLLFLSSCCLRAGGSTAAPCQLLLPQKPPCMQNRLRLPSLLGHAFPPLFCLRTQQTPPYFLPSHHPNPNLSLSLRSGVFIQINFKPSNVVRSVIVATHTNANMQQRTFQGQTLGKKRKCLVDFLVFRPD